MIFTEDLKAYFESKGFTDIYRDYLPDKPDECIGLFLWAHSVPLINDGSGTRYVQVQVRRKDTDEAYRIASELCALLDSGLDEKTIHLTADRWCIARPQNLPKKINGDGKVAVYYFETAMWGDNKP